MDGAGPFKDGINDCVVHGERDAVSARGARHQMCGASAAGRWHPAKAAVVRLRFRPIERDSDAFALFRLIAWSSAATEADEFYAALQADIADADARLVQRQALAGMLWSKQLYLFDVRALAGRRPGAAAAAAGPHPQPRLAASEQCRHHLDAGQVGVSLVRRLGPGVPLRHLRADRSGIRQGSAACCCCASGTCIRTASCPPMNGRSATSTRRCTPGRPGGSTRWTAR